MPSLLLVVVGKDLEPEIVSAALGLRPWRFRRRGEKRSFGSKSGKRIQFSSKYKYGGWKRRYRISRSEDGLVREMTKVAKGLIPRKKKVRALIESGYEIGFVSLVQDTSAPVFPPELHTLLGDLGIHLQIDFWA